MEDSLDQPPVVATVSVGGQGPRFSFCLAVETGEKGALDSEPM